MTYHLTFIVQLFHVQRYTLT